MILTDDNLRPLSKPLPTAEMYIQISKIPSAFVERQSGRDSGCHVYLFDGAAAALHGSTAFIHQPADGLPARHRAGLEPHTDRVMHEKPRPRNEGILTRPFLTNVAIEGW